MVTDVTYRAIVPATLSPQAVACVSAILDQGGQCLGDASTRSAGIEALVAGLTEDDVDAASHQILAAHQQATTNTTNTTNTTGTTGAAGAVGAFGAVVTLQAWDVPEGCGQDIARAVQLALALLAQTAPFVIIEHGADGPGRRITYVPGRVTHDTEHQLDTPTGAPPGTALRGPGWHQVACDGRGDPILTLHDLDRIAAAVLAATPTHRTGTTAEHATAGRRLARGIQEALGLDLPLPQGMAPRAPHPTP